MAKTIIIIDRDVEQVISVCKAIEGIDLKTLTFGSVPSLQQIKANAPDLIIMDHMVSEAEMFDFYNQIKADPFTQPIPVIFVSALDEIHKIAQQCGAFAALHKPFDASDLMALLVTALYS